MDSSDETTIQLVQTSGKTTDFSICVICQSDDKGSLWKAKESSISNLIEAMTERNGHAFELLKHEMFDSSKCMFCQKVTRKKKLDLLNVSTYMACKTILAAAEVIGDENMLLVHRGVNNDQCAAELKYHHNCHASYTSIKSVKTTKPGTSTEYAYGFADLTATIVPKFVVGKAYDMTSLLHKYQVL